MKRTFEEHNYHYRNDHHNNANAILPEEIERFSNLLYSDQLRGREIMQSFVLEDFTRKKYLDLLIDSGKYRNCTILRIMKNPAVLDVIGSIGIERFILFVNRNGFEFEASGSNDCWINLFDNILTNQKFIAAINQMSIEKLYVLFGSDTNRDNSLCGFLQNRNILNSINALQIDRFSLLYRTACFGIVKVMCLLSLPLIGVLNRINLKKLQLLIQYCSFHCYELTRLLRNSSIAKFLISIDLDKFDLILKFYTSQLADLTLFMSQTTAENVNAIDTDKFIFLTNNDFFTKSPYRLLIFADDQDQLNFVNLLSIEKLRIIFKITAEDELVALLSSNGYDVRKNLSFAVALYENGIINNVTVGYAKNVNNVLYNDVYSVFPRGVPIKRILEVSERIESLPKLTDKSIEVFVKSVIIKNSEP